MKLEFYKNRILLSLLVIVTLFLFINIRVIESVYELWSQPVGTYGHGFLILMVCFFILYEKRELVLGASYSVNYWSLVPLFILSLLLTFGNDSIAQVSLPVSLFLIVSAVYGWGITKKLIPAFSLLYFVLPGWGALVSPLQLLTVSVVKKMLGLSNVPAFIENSYVTIPYGVFNVTGGCSGIRYFLVGLTLSIIYGYFFTKDTKRRIMYIFIGAVLSVISNWIRVYIIIMAGYQSKMTHTLVVDGHYFFGWLVFGLSILPLLFYIVYSGKKEVYVVGDEDSGNVQNKNFNNKLRFSPRYIVFNLFLIVTILSGSLIELYITNKVPQTFEFKMPSTVSGFNEAEYVDIWRPLITGQSTSARYTYVSNKKSINLYIDIYDKSSNSEDISNKYNSIVDESWRIVKSTKDNNGYVFLEVESVKSHNKKIIIYWYQFDGFSTGNRYIARLFQSIYYLKGSSRSAIFTLSQECLYDCYDDATITKFMSGMKSTAGNIVSELNR